MSDADGCTQNTDPLKLVREGTSQEQRLFVALDPAYAPVDQRTTSHAIVFAQKYAAMLKYIGAHNGAAGDWTPFFTRDVAARLALVAIEDLEPYKSSLKSWFDYLDNLENHARVADLKDNFGFLYNSIATLAWQLDEFKEGLPDEISLKGPLQNLVKGRLAPAFRRLIAYYRAGVTRSLINATLPSPNILILGRSAVSFESVLINGLSGDWSNGQEWAGYASLVEEDASVYGAVASTFVQINHCSTHNLFKSVFDEFLKAFARVIVEADNALNDTLTTWDKHEPHYALFLAFLRLFEYARAQTNTLTARHLDFYYREILRLREKPAAPGHVHLLVELAKQAASHEFKTGDWFKAGKDGRGNDVYFANDSDFVANRAKVAQTKTLYRHGKEPVGVAAASINQGRIYASPVADSDDGKGAELTSVDRSWHPFHNKIYRDGQLAEIRMPLAETGFAVASHYLLMAGGDRTITVSFAVASGASGVTKDLCDDIVCLYTAEKSWVEKKAVKFGKASGSKLELIIKLDGSDPAVVAYSPKIHGSPGYQFATDLPMLLVKLRQRDDAAYIYQDLQDVAITQIDLKVDVRGLKTLAVSNDFGPVDVSKPFQPFGPSPVANSALVVGSNEAFQKALASAHIDALWQTPPAPYNNKSCEVITEYLGNGLWQSFTSPKKTNIMKEEFGVLLTTDTFGVSPRPYVDAPDLLGQEGYAISSMHGFVRLKLSGDFGQSDYETALNNYIFKVVNKTLTSADRKPEPPFGPFATGLSLSYTTQPQTLDLDSAESRASHYFHIAPFGHAEQFRTPGKPISLLPQFGLRDRDTTAASEAEFYIGVTDFKPPQNLALLFQVVDGTADPQLVKPDAHIHWSYLRDNEWVPFAANGVMDQTGGLLNSGIITFAIPREASTANTLLPSGMHWLRAAVTGASDAVCRLRLTAAQALEATFVDRGNDPAFSAKVLEAGTISKLDQPDSAVKAVSQPFASFGGRGKEEPQTFYTRVSERLRHKDRAIALWDYERLILEAFPQIYKAKCLNHTEYDPNESGTATYRELAPGHVTVVTVPNQQFHNLRDPLRPYTSLGLLQEIDAFLRKRLPCFVRLHVRNPLFEEVQVCCLVRLQDGLDETFYTDKLQEAISRYLSPWAFADGSSPSFGGKIYKSVLINFVEDLPYVDYVSDFQLWHTFSDSGGMQRISADEVEGSKAISILVSARKHQIATVTPAVAKASGEKCPCET